MNFDGQLGSSVAKTFGTKVLFGFKNLRQENYFGLENFLGSKSLLVGGWFAGLAENITNSAPSYSWSWG